MLIESEGSSPTIDPTAYIAPTATICGDVVIGPDTCVAFGAVLTAEGGSLRIGANCVIREQAVIRATEKHDTVIGNHVLIGPHAYLVGCTIGECAFLATGATVFHGASIGARTEVRINGTVHVQTRLPPNVGMPIGWIAVGDPARILPPDRHHEIWEVVGPLNFPKVAYGVDRPVGGGMDVTAITRTVASELRQHHQHDRMLEPSRVSKA